MTVSGNAEIGLRTLIRLRTVAFVERVVRRRDRAAITHWQAENQPLNR